MEASSHWIEYGPVPPDTRAIIFPSAAPQLGLIVSEVVSKGVGSINVIVSYESHPKLLVADIVYTPADKLLAVSAVPPEGDHNQVVIGCPDITNTLT